MKISNIEVARREISNLAPYLEIYVDEKKCRVFLTYRGIPQAELFGMRGIPCVEISVVDGEIVESSLHDAIDEVKSSLAHIKSFLNEHKGHSAQYKQELVGMDKDSAIYHQTKRALKHSQETISILKMVSEGYSLP